MPPRPYYPFTSHPIATRHTSRDTPNPPTMTLPEKPEDGPSSAIELDSAENCDPPLTLDQAMVAHKVNEKSGITSTPAHGDPATQGSELEPNKSKNPLEDMKELSYKCRRIFVSDPDAYAIGRGILEEENESGNLSARSRQAALHLALTEQRILQLETSIRKLESTVNDLPPDFSYDRNSRRDWARYQLHIKRCSRDVFDLHLPWGRDGLVPSHRRREWPAMELLITGVNTPGPNDQTGTDPTPKSSTMNSVPERLRIRYQPLLNHLFSVTKEEISADADEAGTVFLRPFKFFVKHEAAIRDSLPELKELLRKGKEPRDKSTKTLETDLMAKGKGIAQDQIFHYDDLICSLELLIEVIDVDLKPVFDLRRKIADGTLEEIHYADLWHLFERGDYVVSDSTSMGAWEAVSFTGGREPLAPLWTDDNTPSAPVRGFVVDCTSLVFNGQEAVRRLTSLRIPQFQGSRRISSLEVYPLKFSPRREQIETVLLSNGARYLQLVSSPFCHMMLKGLTLDEPPQDLAAQVIIDTVLAMNTNSSWRVPAETIPESQLTLCDHRETLIPNACGHTYSKNSGCCGSDRVFEDLVMDTTDRNIHIRSTRMLDPMKLEDLPEKARMLLPNSVHGFVLRGRQWVTMRIVDLHPVDFLNDFEQLILPTDHKKTIRALVEIHENSRVKDSATPTSVGASLDLVKGKGAGLVILLHGEPGVGKTSTAECIADTTKRPLFPITCGDIGETPLEAEKNLHSNFRMAQKWGCVLLLDEADVFLAKRTQMDIRQNAITSVFLRSLEYYGGILFLYVITTLTH